MCLYMCVCVFAVQMLTIKCEGYETFHSSLYISKIEKIITTTIKYTLHFIVSLKSTRTDDE